ncbi:MAG TPA: AMP-binding protein [Streptosporangiaceae bacterium]|nr:AMP-binding protein [Streptosporangiaceae bacterium]
MAAAPLDAISVEDDAGAHTYGELAAAAADARHRAPHGGQVTVRSTPAWDVAVAFAGLDGWAANVYLVGARDVRDPDPGDTHRGPGSAATRWHLYTSGTTGEPKPFSHTVRSLTRTVRAREHGNPPYDWGLLYSPVSMAGVQVLLHALGTGGRLLDATGLPRLTDRVEWLVAHGVTALSATPTLWRQTLQTPASRQLRLRQVTLGGEIADQPLLDALRRAHPHARITHVFASTETGAAFSVSDGRAGFPRAFLTDPPSGIRLDVRDGVLYVEAPQAGAAGPDGFAPTGDVVTVSGDRVYFLGRATGVANVGGVKVWPEQVETVLRHHPDVSDTLVSVRRNPFSGSILTAEVVATAEADVSRLGALLRAYCAQQLEPAAVPAIVHVVPRLTVTANGKAGRR